MGIWRKNMKIAAIVESMNVSQNMFYMTKCFNKMLNDDISPTCFYLNLSSLTSWPLFSYQNICYASGFFDGVMVATSLETAKVLSKINTNAHKYLYLWDLEWLRSPQNYLENLELLNSMDIISRSTSHSSNIENYCDKKSIVIEDWNYESIKELVWNSK
jgi:hypothetical protein